MLWDREAGVVRLGGGGTWLEGPAWVGDRVLVSDIPGNRVLAWSEGGDELEIALAPAEFCNGRTVARDGRVYQCSHGRRAVEELFPDLATVVVVDRTPSGTRFNSPNDVVVSRDGSLWFSDPPYGILKPEEGYPGDLEYGACHVFRLDPSGVLTAVVTDMGHPNGLAFSPDEAVLYVADTSSALGGTGRHVRAYDVASGSCTGGRDFYVGRAGLIDGFRVDVEGRCWFSDGDTVVVVGPDGSVLDTIPIPERVANVCFGPDGWLFVAATTSLYRLRTTTSDAALAG